MEQSSTSTAINVAFGSVVASALSVGIAFVMAFFVPVVVEGTEPSVRPQAGQVFTHEELERAEREAKARMKAHAADQSFERQSKFSRSMQRSGLLLSWIPWFLLPLVVRRISPAWLFLTLTIPVLMVVATISPIESIAVFAAALCIGAGVRHAYFRIHAI